MDKTKPRNIYAHPFLFAIFPIVSLIAANIDEVELSVLIRPALLSAAGAGILFAILSLISRRAVKGALITTIWIWLFFSYGHIYNSLISAGLLGEEGKARYIFAAWLLIGGISSLAVLRSGRDWQNVNRLLNVAAVAFLITPAFGIVNHELTRTRTLSIRSENTQAVQAEALDEEPSSRTAGMGARPDIYYLVFDRYSSSKQLKRVLDYDNSDFDDYLREREFKLAKDSTANYAVTYLSLSSSLNLDYHREAKEQKDVEEILQNHRVWRFLKKRGYKYIHYGSAWPPTFTNPYADRSINYYELSFDSFDRLLLNTTMAGPVLDRLYPQKQEDRRRLLNQLNALSKAPRIKGPKFVFAHVLLPHTPYLFDDEGNQIEAGSDDRPEIELYQDYVTFANMKIEALIDSILSESDEPPVIIVQADEGFRFDIADYKERYRIPGYMDLHYGVLNAYYLPGIPADEYIYDSITPVNSFRVLFNAYFDTDFKLLEDENYLLLHKGNSLSFKKVTDQLDR